MNLRLRSRLRLLSILQVNGLQSALVRKKPAPTEPCICKNCGAHFIGNFCPQCGQKGNTRRLTFLNMIEDVFSLITNFDSGILRSVTELFWRPGHMIRDYIQGKRKGYMKPLSLLFCIGSIYYIFVWLFSRESFFQFNADDQLVQLPDEISKLKPIIMSMKDYFEQWINNPGLATLTFILPMVPASWLCFRKTRYGRVFNLMEHLHIQVFLACQMLIITIVQAIIMLMTEHHLELLNFDLTKSFLFFVWDYKQLFDITWRRSFKLSILSFLFSALIILLIMFLFGFCAAAYLHW